MAIILALEARFKRIMGIGVGLCQTQFQAIIFR